MAVLPLAHRRRLGCRHCCRRRLSVTIAVLKLEACVVTPLLAWRETPEALCSLSQTDVPSLCMCWCDWWRGELFVLHHTALLQAEELSIVPKYCGSKHLLPIQQQNVLLQWTVSKCTWEPPSSCTSFEKSLLCSTAFSLSPSHPQPSLCVISKWSVLCPCLLVNQTDLPAVPHLHKVLSGVSLARPSQSPCGHSLAVPHPSLPFVCTAGMAQKCFLCPHTCTKHSYCTCIRFLRFCTVLAICLVVVTSNMMRLSIL